MKDRHLYRFGQFELYTDETVLHRDDEVISLTPKMLDTLQVLLRHQGEIVDKETFLKEVWPDSFVEEGNIAFNIRQLRKILDDDAQSPTYIETVPRRGYRFIADVEAVVEKPNGANNGSENLPRRFENPQPVPVKSTFHPFTVVFVVFVCLVGAGVVYFVLSQERTSAPVLSQPFATEKLSTSGTVFGAAISPDGKTVVYSTRAGGKQSVWLRQLESGNNVPLIPPTDTYYADFTFSPDGNSIYFARANNDIEKPDIYRVPILGGIPEKIVSFTEGTQSISPDGGKISFVRCPRRADEWCSLWIADARDGKNEKKLLSRTDPNRIADNEFSPDGKRIAFATGQSRNAANEFQLMEYDLETAAERPVTSEKFFNIKNLAWLPNQSGLLITASRIPNKYFRIWHVSASDGVVQPLTKDSEAYSILSLDGDAANLVSTQIKQDFRMYLFDVGNPSEKRLLADGVRPSFASNGKLYYASIMSGNDEIWSMNADGSEQRQLTNDLAGESSPIASPDGRTVFFASNRSGESQVWKMNADGSNQIQVTKNGSGGPLFVTPDGKFLYYGHPLHGNLWSVSLESGEEKIVLEKPFRRFAFSPDGLRVIGWEERPEGRTATIFALADGQPFKDIEVPKDKPRLLDCIWMPDGKSVAYLVSEANYQKGVIFQQSLDGGVPRQIADLKDEQLSEVATLAISPDGKSFVTVVGTWKHDAVLIKGLK